MQAAPIAKDERALHVLFLFRERRRLNGSSVEARLSRQKEKNESLSLQYFVALHCSFFFFFSVRWSFFFSFFFFILLFFIVCVFSFICSSFFGRVFCIHHRRCRENRIGHVPSTRTPHLHTLFFFLLFFFSSKKQPFYF